MTGRLKGARALVTGGDSGIGRAVAEAFAGEGADVAIVYRTDEAGAAETCRRVRARGHRALAVRADIGREEDVARIYREVRDGLGAIDVLVNNAGVEQRGPWEEFALDDFERIVRTNLTGTFLMVREALRGRHLRDGARIINTGSIQGLEGSADDPAYSATKGAIHALTKSLAKYLLKRGIRVNVVAPGPVDTPMLRDQSPGTLETGGGDRYPLGVARPEDIAPTFVLLASRDGAPYTGQILTPISGHVTAG